MKLKIARDVLNGMLAHARREEPNEACGYLASKDDHVTRQFELTNVDAAPDHYTMDPQEQFETIRRIRSEGLNVAAVYHSHPETPARPSVEDIRLAQDPNMVYVIVSLMAGVNPVMAYNISKGEVSKVPVEIVPSSPSTKRR